MRVEITSRENFRTAGIPQTTNSIASKRKKHPEGIGVASNSRCFHHLLHTSILPGSPLWGDSGPDGWAEISLRQSPQWDLPTLWERMMAQRRMRYREGNEEGSSGVFFRFLSWGDWKHSVLPTHQIYQPGQWPALVSASNHPSVGTQLGTHKDLKMAEYT